MCNEHISLEDIVPPTHVYMKGAGDARDMGNQASAAKTTVAAPRPSVGRKPRITMSPEDVRGVARSFTNAVSLLGVHAVPNLRVNRMHMEDRYWKLMLDVKSWEIFVCNDDDIKWIIGNFLGEDSNLVVSRFKEHEDSVSLYVWKVFIDLPCYYFGRKFSVASMLLNKDGVARAIFFNLSGGSKVMPYKSIFRALRDMSHIEACIQIISELWPINFQLTWQAVRDMDEQGMHKKAGRDMDEHGMHKEAGRDADGLGMHKETECESNELSFLRGLIMVQKILAYSAIARAAFYEKFTSACDLIPEHTCTAKEMLGIDAWCNRREEHASLLRKFITCDPNECKAKQVVFTMVIGRSNGTATLDVCDTY